MIHSKNTLSQLLALFSLLAIVIDGNAQSRNQVWKEDFGVVDDSLRMDFADPFKSMPGHIYQGDTTMDVQDGSYAIANSTSWCLHSGTFFTAGRDHTGNENGGMLVVNTDGKQEGSVIYEQKIDFPLCSNNDYYFSIYAASITSFTCTNANLILRITGDDGTVIEEVETGDIPFWPMFGPDSRDPKAERTWAEYGIKFNSSGYNSITLQVINNAICKNGKKASELDPWETCDSGNDFVIDDITLYRYDTEDVPDPNVENSTISAISQQQGCIYTSAYAVPDSVLKKWKSLYDEIYFLWQASEDGFNWTDLPEPTSGIDKRKAQMDVDATKNMRYRVIITGAETEAKAKEVAGQISVNGGPDDGCYKFSISNTLAAAKPKANCTFSEKLMSIFNEDFGTADSAEIKSCAEANLTLFTGETPTAGGYAVVSDPSYTKKNSWDGIYSRKDHTGNKNGAMLFAYLPEVSTPEVFYEKTINASFCSCKTYMLSLFAAINQQWTNTKFDAVVLDKNKDTLSVTGCALSAEGSLPAWKHFYADFIVPDNYQGDITIQLTNAATTPQLKSAQIVIDDISVRICGEKLPEASLFLEKDPSLTDLSGYSCEEKKEIDLSGLTEWQDLFSSPVYCLWQRSDNGGASWQNLTASGTGIASIETSNEDGTPELYRVILAETESIAKQIAINGASYDGCDKYIITNSVSLQCTPTICEYGSDRLVVWKEDFKSVPAGERKDCDNLIGLTYAPSGNTGDGHYCIVSESKDGSLPEYDWFSGSKDHTGNKDGGFLIINNDDYSATDRLMYEKKIDFELCPNTWYYFSIYATSVSGFIADGYSGVLCNFTFEIIGEDGITVLASDKSGEVPNSDREISTWNNYGVGFNSGANKNVTLRIYDSGEKNVAGNDMAIDDISLIACHMKIPEVTLSSDFEGICGDSTSITLSSLAKWDSIYQTPAYCLWQKSTDGGLTWNNMTESGTSIDSLRILMKESAEGEDYHVIIAPNQTTAEEIAQNGHPNDLCIKFSITNTIKIQCTPPICEYNDDRLMVWKDDFGSVAPGNRKTCSNLKGHRFRASGNTDDGEYAVVSDTKYAADWFSGGTDHTGNKDGGFLVVNIDESMQDKVIYEQKIDFEPCADTWYFFSAFASSISRRLASNEAGVYCNLTFEIVGEDETTVLGSTDSGEIPNSPFGTSAWNNYGVSFNSGSNKSVTLRIYDHAGNGKKGNDLALDDISLIACHVKAPEVQLTAGLTAEYEGICGDSTTLSLSDLSDWKAIYNDKLYCLWQKSLDDGESWASLTESGYDVSSVKIPLEKNPNGTRYRVVIAGPEPEVPAQIAANGRPDNSCYVYTTTNISTISCHCETPKISLSQTDTIICNNQTEKVHLVVTPLTDAVIDSIVWAYKEEGSNIWNTLIEDNNADTAFTLPTSDTDYMVYAISDTCHSDTLYTSIKVNKAIKLTLATDTTICEGSSIALNNVSQEGTPTKYYWNGIESAVGNHTIADITNDTTITLHATDGICHSDTLKMDISVQDSIRGSIISDQQTCEGSSIRYETQPSGFISKFLWESKNDSALTFSKIEEGSKDGYEINAADSSQTIRVTYEGDKCPALVLQTHLNVFHPAEIKLTTDKDSVCINTSITLKAEGENIQTLKWMSRTDTTSSFSLLDETTDTEKTLSPNTITQYRVIADNSDICPIVSSNTITIFVEDSIRFTASLAKDTICIGTEMTLIINGANFDADKIKWESRKEKEPQFSEMSGSSGFEYKETPTTTTDYKVTVQAQVCPSKAETLHLETERPSVLFLSVSDTLVCVNSEISINIDATNFDNVTFVSRPTNQESADGSKEEQFMEDGSGPKTRKENISESRTYELRQTQTMVCPLAKPILITVEKEDSMKFSFTKNQLICRGTEVELRTKLFSGTIDQATYTRQAENKMPESFNPGSMTFYETPTESTTYTVTFSGEVCPALTKSTFIEVEQPAKLEITTDKELVCKNGTITLSVNATNTDSVRWEMQPLSSFQYAILDETDKLTKELPLQESAIFRAVSIGERICPKEASNEIEIIAEDSLKLEIDSVPDVICLGTNIHLSAKLNSGSYLTYAWVKESGNKTDTLSPTLSAEDTPIHNSTYTVFATSAVCPETRISASLEVEQPLTALLSSPLSGICENSEIELFIETGNTSALRWEKKEDGDFQFTTFSNATEGKEKDTPQKSTAYRVTASNFKACPDIQSNEIWIEVEDSVNVTLIADEKVCPGWSTDLVAQTEGNPSSLIWDEINDNGIHNLNTGNEHKLTITPNTTTKYQVKATAKYCPEATDIQTVEVDTLPKFGLTIAKDSICEGESISISTDFPYEPLLVWEYATVNSNTYKTLAIGGTQHNDQPDKSGKYRLTTYTQFGCPAGEKTISIHVDSKIAANVYDTTICLGEVAYLQTFPATGGYKYLWSVNPDFSDTLSAEGKVELTPTETNTYHLKIRNGLCQEEKVSTIQVAPLPNISSYEYIGFRTISFTAEGGTGNYQYDFGFGFKDSNTFEKILYSKDYHIRVKDELGCIGDTTLTTPTYNITIPDFFTPNGDGINEHWEIANLDKFESFTVRIFDRFGKQLYKYSDPNLSWDGTYNGYAMPSTDYWYIIDIEDIDKQYAGHFTLLRR